MFTNVAPPLVESCHCTVGVGFPLAAAVKLTFDPAVIDWFCGFVVTVGGKFTVSVAAVVVADPPELVNTAWYLLPFCPAVTFDNVNVVVVAPDVVEVGLMVDSNTVKSEAESLLRSIRFLP